MVTIFSLPKCVKQWMWLTHSAYFTSPSIDTGTWIHSMCANLPTVHMPPVHLLIQGQWYSMNSLNVCQILPTLQCLQSIYWYLHNDISQKSTRCVTNSPTVHMPPVHLLIQEQWYSLNSLNVCQTLHTVHMSPVHLLILAQWYSLNPLSVRQAYPLCICLQFIYWYRNNDTPWIHSVCVKLTHCAYVPGPSVDAGTMILPESTQCVASASITARLVVVTASIRIWGKMHREHWLLKFHVNISDGVQGFSDMTFVWLVAVLPADKFENRIF